MNVSIRTNTAAQYHTLVVNGSRNKLFWYESGGCLNTNLEFTGVGRIKYSNTVARSLVMNVTVPDSIRGKIKKKISKEIRFQIGSSA